MSKLLEKLAKASTIKHSAILGESKFFTSKDETVTDLPILNLAFSGSLKGGFASGLTMIAGPSRHFKSNLALFCIKSYLTKHKDAVCLFYDSEFGAPPPYLAAFGIDTSRVLHTPIIHIEQLKFDLIAQLENIERGDKVIVFIDSVGNLASKKETDDALEGKSVADMTRAKQLKSLWRMATPQFTVKDIPCITINHSYETMEMFSKAIMSGGCLLPGQKIKMADDTLRPIERIAVGDMVKTLHGDKEVTHTWNPETLAVGTPECYQIVFENGSSIECSAEHKFLVDGEWVMAKNLKDDDDCQEL